MFLRTDPGDCLICGAAHCVCGGPTTVVQLPERDAAAALARGTPLEPDVVPPAALPPGAFTTGTYRGKKKPR